jgi:hypothetical protein
MPVTHQEATEAILAQARAEHDALLEQLSPALRASLPVDASGITRAIDYLGELVGVSGQLRREQSQGHRANPAVLHGRVFGRTPLSPDTVLAAFADGARVRMKVLEQLSRAAGGAGLEAAVRPLLERDSPTFETGLDTAAATVRATYAAQEEAVLRIAAHLDRAGDDSARPSPR